VGQSWLMKRHFIKLNHKRQARELTVIRSDLWANIFLALKIGQSDNQTGQFINKGFLMIYKG
jgi:hypothetical protein